MVKNLGDLANNITVGTVIKQDDFKNYIPNGDISFTASFNSAKRLYKVKLYDDDGSAILLEAELPWDADIGAKLSGDHYQLTYKN